jgi:hypothetical protein
MTDNDAAHVSAEGANQLNTTAKTETGFFIKAATLVAEGHIDKVVSSRDRLAELSAVAEKHACNRGGGEAVLETMAIIAMMRASGVAGEPLSDDFHVGQTVREIHGGRTGIVLGDSPRTGGVIVEWAGSRRSETMRPNAIALIPGAPNTKIAEGRRILFDKNGMVEHNGVVLSVSPDRRAMFAGCQAILVEGHGGALHAFTVTDSDFPPFSTRLVKIQAEEHVSDPAEARKEMLKGFDWLPDRDSSGLREISGVIVESKNAEHPSPSQTIFQSVMTCPGNAVDAAWMADKLSRDTRFVEAFNKASNAGTTVDPAIVKESMAAAEKAFTKSFGRVPVISRLHERMADPLEAKRRNTSPMGSARRAHDLVYGKPTNFYMKRQQEVRKAAEDVGADSATIVNFRNAVMDIHNRANMAMNSPKVASHSREIASGLIDLFNIMLNNQSEPWVPIRASSQPLRTEVPGKDAMSSGTSQSGVAGTAPPAATVPVIGQKPGKMFEFHLHGIIAEQIESNADAYAELDRIMSQMGPGRMYRIRVTRETEVPSKVREQAPSKQGLAILVDLLKNVRIAANMLKSNPSRPFLNGRLAMAIMKLIKFVYAAKGDAWDVIGSMTEKNA